MSGTELQWACCTSSIGPRCGHVLGGQGVTLERLAIESVQIAPDPQSGYRPGDPLLAHVTADTWRDVLPVAELVIGKPIEVSGGVDMAARVRAQLRRHAIRMIDR